MVKEKQERKKNLQSCQIDVKSGKILFVNIKFRNLTGHIINQNNNNRLMYNYTK
jgi:major membrane immunogen (membrane-anchored lipoprotein)